MRRSTELVRDPARGSVLVLSLWIVVLLSLFSLVLAQSAQRKVSVYQHLSAKEDIRIISKSAVNQVISDFEAEPAGKIPHPPGAGGSLQSFRTGRGTVDVRIEDENGKLNLNKSDVYVLKNFLKISARLSDERAEKLACAIVDYRDPDDLTCADANHSAEIDAYREARLDYGPKNRDLEYPAEVLRAPGMTKEIYLSIKDYITIYGDGTVNANTAPKAVLMALDLSEELADKILWLRERGGGEPVFSDASQIKKTILARYPVTDAEAVSLDHAVRFGHLGTASGCRRMTAAARLDTRGMSGRTVCVYAVHDGIKYWAEL